MDKRFLLTYEIYDDNIPTYSWFDSIEEMVEFVNIHDVDIIDAIEIHQCKNIEIIKE